MILVVDDDVDIRDALSELLSDLGYEVRCACHGRDALAQLRTGERPQVILLDMKMPVMDGEAFRWEQLAHPEWADIPVIILSATVDCPSAAKKLRTQGCLRKPFAPGPLLQELARVCGADPPSSP
jgi:CheY-like chemotaxis protein